MATDDRLLQVLRALNELGSATALDLHRATGISRPAVYRVLENLCRHGYVKRVPKDSRFCLTAEIRKLSCGFRDDAWIADVGAPIIAGIQAQFRWPTSLATPERGHMIVRETTRYRSPYVFDSGHVGMSLPMLESSLGLAYLAHCSDRSREIALALLRQSDDPLDEVAQNAARTQWLLRHTVRRGYAFRDGGFTPNTGSISVPISTGAECLGAICVTFARSVVRQHEAVAQFLPSLRAAARDIATHLQS